MKHVPRFLIATAACIGIARSAPVSLVIAPGGAFDVTYTLSTGPKTSATLQIAGDLAADVELTNGVVSRFRFAGGNVAYSDTTSDIILSTFPFTAKIKLLTRNIVSSVTSNSSAGAIDSTTGVIVNSGHQLVQDRGIITTRYIVGGTVAQESIRDLTAQPDNNPMVGVTTVSANLSQDLGYKAIYDISFSHTRDESRNQPAPEINGTLNIREVGGFSAAGELTVPGQDFTDWAVLYRDQLPLSLTDRHTSTDQPLVMLYAFDATAGPWSPPVSFDPMNGVANITLPTGGLKAPVRVEFSTTLAADSWVPMEKGDRSPAVFHVGESGTAELKLPASGNGFVRLSLAE